MKQRGLVFLDMLLDSRHSTVKHFGEQVAEMLAESPAYRARHDDVFSRITNGVVDDAEYKRLYAARDIDTLANALMTDFVYFLRGDMKEGALDLLRGVQVDLLALDINVWPYDLDPVSAETIRRSIAYFMPPEVQVSIKRLEPALLTPKFLETHYEMMAIYDHEDWLAPNQTALLEYPIFNFVILTPMIATGGVIPEATEQVRDPFRARSAVFQRHIGLHYISVDKVCYNPIIRQLLRSQRLQAAQLEHPSPQEQTPPGSEAPPQAALPPPASQ